MRIVLLGCPGAGKGTQAEFIARDFHLPLISTGQLLRSEVQSESKLGREIKDILNSGRLVDNATVISLITKRLASKDSLEGFLLDGFPRTLEQAKALDEAKIHIDTVIELAVPDAEIVKRLTGRLVHVPSGRTYHTIFNPPKVAGKDDVTGEALQQRDDDSEATVLNRLAVYHQQTEPISVFYQNKAGVSYLKVDGTQSVADIYAKIQQFLRQLS